MLWHYYICSWRITEVKVNGKLEAKKVVRVKGCPVPVPFFTLYACHYGKVRSPYMDPRAMYSLPYYAALAAASKLLKQLGLRK